jgi:hypothetical protein
LAGCSGRVAGFAQDGFGELHVTGEMEIDNGGGGPLGGQRQPSLPVYRLSLYRLCSPLCVWMLYNILPDQLIVYRLYRLCVTLRAAYLPYSPSRRRSR